MYDVLKKCFPYFSILTDQISLSHCFYFLGYWLICVLLIRVSRYQCHKHQSPCKKDKLVEVTEEIRKPTYS